MSNKYAIFVAATENYLSYLNALLNSIEKRGLHTDCNLSVYVMHHDNFNRKYLQDIENAFSFEVIPIEIMRGDISLPDTTKRIEYIKRCRYKKMVPLALKYNAVCLLDCDMFIVSPEFMNLFDLVNDTYYLIGCNEKIKWDIGGNYFYHPSKRKILDKPAKLMNFICNTPAIFNMSRWREVFEAYEDVAINGRQYKNGNIDNITGIGDIMCWNIAIQQQNRANDIICFPMETMAQVHFTNMRNWTLPLVEQGYWRTNAGDRIYIMHGRMASWTYEGFFKKHIYLETGEKKHELMLSKYIKIKKIKPHLNKIEDRIKKGLMAIQREWYDLNFNHSIKLNNYVEVLPEWENFK